jgi:hypothetical protein
MLISFLQTRLLALVVTLPIRREYNRTRDTPQIKLSRFRYTSIRDGHEFNTNLLALRYQKRKQDVIRSPRGIVYTTLHQASGVLVVHVFFLVLFLFIHFLYHKIVIIFSLYSSSRNSFSVLIVHLFVPAWLRKTTEKSKEIEGPYHLNEQKVDMICIE